MFSFLRVVVMVSQNINKTLTKTKILHGYIYMAIKGDCPLGCSKEKYFAVVLILRSLLPMCPKLELLETKERDPPGTNKKPSYLDSILSSFQLPTCPFRSRRLSVSFVSIHHSFLNPGLSSLSL